MSIIQRHSPTPFDQEWIQETLLVLVSMHAVQQYSAVILTGQQNLLNLHGVPGSWVPSLPFLPRLGSWTLCTLLCGCCHDIFGTHGQTSSMGGVSPRILSFPYLLSFGPLGCGPSLRPSRLSLTCTTGSALLGFRVHFFCPWSAIRHVGQNRPFLLCLYAIMVVE